MEREKELDKTISLVKQVLEKNKEKNKKEYERIIKLEERRNRD